MAGKRDELFLWRRRTDPLGAIREGKGKDSIQNWIKKVQVASDAAAREVLGNEFTSSNMKCIIPDDDALWEAQELVDSWLREKSLADLQLEVEYQSEGWSRHGDPILNSEQFLDEFDTKDISDYRLTDIGGVIGKSGKAVLEKKDSFLYSEDIDDDVAVESVLSELMQKDYVGQRVFSDLGFSSVEKLAKDPRPTMDIRHKQVKERSQTRKIETDRSRRKQQEEKEVERLANEIVMKEEKEKRLKAERDEVLMQKEMTRIRKEMEDERRKANEELARKRMVLQKVKEEIEKEENIKKNAVRKRLEKRKELDTKMRKEILIDLEEKTIAKELDMQKLKHKYFSQWHSVILHRRVQLGKARAMSDWKCKLRAWNAWKSYIAYVRSNHEAQAITLAMKEKYRKEQMAHQHYCLILLRKSLLAWQLWIVKRKTKRTLREEENKKKQKMAAFLDALEAEKLRVKKESIEHAMNNIFQSERAALSNQGRSDVRSLKTTSHPPENRIHLAWQPLSNRSESSHIDLMEETKPTTCSEIQQNEKKSHSKKRQSAVATRALRILSSHPTLAAEKNAVANFVESIDHGVKLACAGVNNVSNPALHLREVSDCRETSEGGESSTGGIKLKTPLSARKNDERSVRPLTKPLRLAMEERARERERKKKELDEKKRKQEEEKLKLLQEQEEIRLKEELEAKRDRIKKKKEEQRLESEREAARQEEIKRMKDLTERARSHYAGVILRKYGMEPWKRLVMIANLNQQIAEKYHYRTLVKQCVCGWKEFTRESIMAKEQLADKCYRAILLRRGLASFRKYCQHIERLHMVAIGYHQSLLVRRYLSLWQDYVTEERLATWGKENTANEHSERRMVRKCFRFWRLFIQQAKDERDKEKRRNLLRQQVKAWLPDFKGKEVRDSLDGK